MHPDRIIGWKGLAEVSGIHAATLQMRQARGKLPLTLHWIEGRRAFDLAEVRQWLDNETKQAKEH